MYSIALSGKIGSGKSTCANALRGSGYIPLSFAAPLKDMVIEADPLIACAAHGRDLDPHMLASTPVHLSDILDKGWTFEDAKREFSEVRRSLQRIGQGIRRIDPDYWVRLLVSEVHALQDTFGERCPIVVPDARYVNEADALRRLGFKLVRVTRPADPRGMTTDDTRAAMHDSETALDGYTFDHTISNVGSEGDLYAAIVDYATA